MQVIFCSSLAVIVSYVKYSTVITVIVFDIEQYNTYMQSIFHN